MNKSLSLSELNTYLDDLLQPALFQDYCPNGLQVEGKETITSIATAVSASLETIEAAIEAGVDALIVHHGLFWKGDPYPVTGTRKKKLSLLLKAGLSLFAYHLPLDAHKNLGNNWTVAQDLNWHNCVPFGEFNGSYIGVQGQTEEVSLEDLTQKLEGYYEHKAHVAPGGSHRIRKIALISGGAHKEISEAATQGIDAFITGSFDEPIWHIAKEEGVHFIALGHSATERVGPRALGKHISKELKLKFTFIDIENPF
jgi:dinuclear metal center YbgI/SA1388 family protein